MVRFKFINVNPKGRKTGDCSTRAIVGVLNIPYTEALKLQYEESLKCYYDPTSKQVMERVLQKFGYVKMKQPRYDDGSKVPVNEMDRFLTRKQMEEGVLITIAGHHTCIKNGEIQDLWDCGGKCVGNYYVKA